MIGNNIHTRRGFTLFYALLVTSLLLALGLSVFNITYKELILSSGARDSATAFYSADAGLECALFWDLKYTGISSPAFGFYGDSLSSGLARYWRFNEGEGVALYDFSGGNHHGVLTNMDSDDSWVSGHQESALTFDGVDDYVALDEPVQIAGPFTLSLWYNVVNDDTTARMITGGGPEDNPGAGRKIGFLVSGKSFSYFVRLNDGGQSDSSVAVPDDGAWHNLVLRRDDDGYVDLFVDGKADRLFGNSKQTGDFQMYALGGNDPTANNQMFLGSLDDVRVYNRALSDAEVEATANGVSNLIFTAPVIQGSGGVTCAGADMTDPEAGWDSETGWDVVTEDTAATTTFDISFDNGRCATVEVVKNTSTTTIVSRGYNSCVEANPRRVERAIRAEY